MSITGKEIENVVLAEDDFGHEMRVGGILCKKHPKNDFAPSVRITPPLHGGTYKDPVTGKTRQFDYRCKIIRGSECGNPINIYLALECKNLNPDFPLVVCGRPRTEEESYHLYITRNENGMASVRKAEGKGSFYEPNDFVGKSLLRLKKKQNEICADGDSEIYDRWTQALASCQDLAFSAFHDKECKGCCAFIMPTVVVPDNSLWTVSYNSQGVIQEKPKKVDQCEFYVEQKLLLELPFVLTHIHFVTLNGLLEILAGFSDGYSSKWDRIFT